MPKSKVYFMNLRTHSGVNILDRLEALVKKAGILGFDYNKKLTAIKVHFGEPGNVAYIRPNYVRRIVELVKKNGGLPFLTDANTLYKGRRGNAPDHLDSAYENGFNPFATGCHIIIADGIKGTDYREITVNQKNVKKAKIGSAIADADILISMNHFKGHEATGFGGALKNIGMGSGSIGGKLEMHSGSKPKVVRDMCTKCGVCTRNCSQEAITLGPDKIAVINYDKCIGCGQCVAVCQFNAAQVQWGGTDIWEKISEYSMAVLKDKPSFHINFIQNVSPNCDCWSNNDQAIVADIGILASFDPVALDKACVDKVNAAPGIEASAVGKIAPGEDKFHRIFPNCDWKAGMAYAEKIGLGSQDYELVEI
jgi:uncharacterized protein